MGVEAEDETEPNYDKERKHDNLNRFKRSFGLHVDNYKLNYAQWDQEDLVAKMREQTERLVEKKQNEPEEQEEEKLEEIFSPKSHRSVGTTRAVAIAEATKTGI